MNQITEIYVQLLNESVDVWRPVQAEHIHSNIYRIIEQSYDRNLETWEFNPKDLVIGEQIETADGKFLAAIRKAEII